jgi:Tol biopolymer transport system component
MSGHKGVAVLGSIALLLSVLVGTGVTRADTERRTGTIAFLRSPPAGGGASLFVIRPDGTGLRRLTPAGTGVFGFAWSPDGSLIAYTVREAPFSDRRDSLWLVRPDGTGHRLLVPNAVLSSPDVSWSPDGKEIALAGGPRPKTPFPKGSIFVVSVAGGKPRRLRSGYVGEVAWSPRGGEIAYGDGGGTIWAIGVDGSKRRRLAGGQALGLGLPKWSPDGSRLGFAAGRYAGIAVADGGGSDLRLITDHAYNEYGFAWSPDSRSILYGKENRRGVYVIGADGRSNRRVTGDSPPQTGWGALAWSPSGGAIVYDTGAVDATGTSDTDLYLIGIDGRGKVRLTSTPDVDVAPSWVAR